MNNSAIRHFCHVATVLALILTPGKSSAQTESASIYGRVSDQSGAVIPDAQVRLHNIDTNSDFTRTTNQEGFYLLPALKPGRYLIVVGKQGFKTVTLKDITLNIQDNISRNFNLEVGSTSESVTVSAEAATINTTDASVSTVVDQTYVANIPLNGRSFQDLILLTPGTVTVSPQSFATLGQSGEFSINGQRTEANYYTVDGVSANTGVSAGDVQFGGNSGSLGSSTALGTTQSLVSVDALEEFRVQGSTYSAEYGRSPGGQLSFLTRSGTNQWHGSAYDYLRNGFFDAQDWFSDFFGKPQPALKQNDFGGTLGGPIEIPGFYNGKDKSFFFFSYEGLRLTQPQPANVSYAPTVALRQSAPAAFQPVLNAWPIPNGADLGNGLAEFIGTWSNPSHVDSTSIRFDQKLNEKTRAFFRFSDTGSAAEARQTSVAGTGGGVPSDIQVANYTNRTYTLGATSILSSRFNNEFRLNYSSNDTITANRIDDFGGAQTVDLAKLQGISTSAAYSIGVGANFVPFSSLIQSFQSAVQRQWNFIDTVSISLGSHQLKFGGDYRRLAPIQKRASPATGYFYFSQNALQSNTPDFADSSTAAPAYPVYTNFSAFVQDEWKVAARLSVSMGLRWEVNPAPGAARGNLPYTVQGSLPNLSLAPQGTPLWQTTWFNFAPRLGAAYILRGKPEWETVVRGGGGVFFDTGQQLGSLGYIGPGFVGLTSFSNPFPAPIAVINPAITNPPVPPYSETLAFPKHLQLPYSLQWNLSFQQALGREQSVTASYVGSAGRRLLREMDIFGGPLNPDFQGLVLGQNGLTSDYDSLQLQYQRRLSQGLTALASYTWAHAIDYGSFNNVLAAVRGNSDFDVRHNFSAAFSYDLPNRFQDKLARALLNNWGLDDRFTVRTGFPVAIDGPSFLDPVTGIFNFAGLNLTGMPIYVKQCASPLSTGPAQIPCPGGRGINPVAFAPPAGCDMFSCPGAIQGSAPRNFVRGLGEWQMNLAVRREFPLTEKIHLQFRAEAFNIFNHPNFGMIDSFFGDPTFGEMTSTLAGSLGVLSPVYQSGGARSMQFALKLKF